MEGPTGLVWEPRGWPASRRGPGRPWAWAAAARAVRVMLSMFLKRTFTSVLQRSVATCFSGTMMWLGNETAELESIRNNVQQQAIESWLGEPSALKRGAG